MQQFGSWFVKESNSTWQERLDYTSNYVIERTGMTRNELKKLLRYLDEQGIIR